MSYNPQEFALLLFESVIPDEVKNMIISDILPQMTLADIKDLYEILKIEKTKKDTIKNNIEKKLKKITKTLIDN